MESGTTDSSVAEITPVAPSATESEAAPAVTPDDEVKVPEARVASAQTFQRYHRRKVLQNLLPS